MVFYLHFQLLQMQSNVVSKYRKKLKKLKIPATMRYSDLNLQDYIMKIADKESGREDE